MRFPRLKLVLVLLLGANVWATNAPTVHRHHRHFLHWHRPKELLAFPPSRESLVLQNKLADQLGLARYEDFQELDTAVERGDLVPITENHYVQLSSRLPRERAYLRPFANDFLQRLGKDYYDQFGYAIQVNSAVRPKSVQKKLLRWNINAAPIVGETASSHMAGATFDLQRRGLSKPQIRFLQIRLLFYHAQGRVIVEEELHEPCFHIMVGKPVLIPTEIPVMEPLILSPEAQNEVT